MSQTSISVQDRRELIAHPAYAHRIPDASLPPAALDPNPAATLALHRLWALLRPLIRLQPGEITVVPPQGRPNFTPGEALDIVGSQLVSSLNFIAFKVSRSNFSNFL